MVNCRLEVVRQPMVSGLAVTSDLKLFKPFKSPLGLGMDKSSVRKLASFLLCNCCFCLSMFLTSTLRTGFGR